MGSRRRVELGEGTRWMGWRKWMLLVERKTGEEFEAAIETTWCKVFNDDR